MEQERMEAAACPQEPPQADGSGEIAQALEARLAQREREVTRRELRAGAMEALSERRLPAELAELLDYTDEGACAASLQRVQKVWQQAVQKGVESRVAGAAPRTGAGNGGARRSMREAISAHYGR